MDNNERVKAAKKVTLTGFVVNIFLSIIKLTAGIAGRSSAMLADGMHSFSDLLTDIIVLAFIDISGKAKDEDHSYGHGKFETFATLLISLVLLLIGAGILISGLKKVFIVIKGEIIEQPGLIALYAALLSIVSKEALYWYNLKAGKRINNQAVIANGWHHRSDALSSVGTAAGISGAIFLGESWRILDPLAGIIVSFFIIIAALRLIKPSADELLESSLPAKVIDDIIQIIESVPGVRSHHNLKTRRIGNIYAIEVHAKVDKDLSVEASHEIATQIENDLRKKYGQQTHVGVHIEPFYG